MPSPFGSLRNKMFYVTLFSHVHVFFIAMFSLHSKSKLALMSKFGHAYGYALSLPCFNGMCFFFFFISYQSAQLVPSFIKQLVKERERVSLSLCFTFLGILL